MLIANLRAVQEFLVLLVFSPSVVLAIRDDGSNAVAFEHTATNFLSTSSLTESISEVQTRGAGIPLEAIARILGNKQRLTYYRFSHSVSLLCKRGTQFLEMSPPMTEIVIYATTTITRKIKISPDLWYCNYLGSGLFIPQNNGKGLIGVDDVAGESCADEDGVPHHVWGGRFEGASENKSLDPGTVWPVVAKDWGCVKSEDSGKWNCPSETNRFLVGGWKTFRRTAQSPGVCATQLPESLHYFREISGARESHYVEATRGMWILVKMKRKTCQDSSLSIDDPSLKLPDVYANPKNEFGNSDYPVHHEPGHFRADEEKQHMCDRFADRIKMKYEKDYSATVDFFTAIGLQNEFTACCPQFAGVDGIDDACYSVADHLASTGANLIISQQGNEARRAWPELYCQVKDDQVLHHAMQRADAGTDLQGWLSTCARSKAALHNFCFGSFWDALSASYVKVALLCPELRQDQLGTERLSAYISHTCAPMTVDDAPEKSKVLSKGTHTTVFWGVELPIAIGTYRKAVRENIPIRRGLDVVLSREACTDNISTSKEDFQCPEHPEHDALETWLCWDDLAIMEVPADNDGSTNAIMLRYVYDENSPDLIFDLHEWCNASLKHHGDLDKILPDHSRWLQKELNDAPKCPQSAVIEPCPDYQEGEENANSSGGAEQAKSFGTHRHALSALSVLSVLAAFSRRLP